MLIIVLLEHPISAGVSRETKTTTTTMVARWMKMVYTGLQLRGPPLVAATLNLDTSRGMLTLMVKKTRKSFKASCEMKMAN